MVATPTPSPTRLYTKLAEVISEVGYVAKDGRNDFQNYNYTSAEALLAAVRGPLSARSVVLMPSLTAISEREYTTSKGKASIVTTAHVTFTFVDGDTGETYACEWAGQGDDPADKGLGKAFTNAIKTFLREQFLIPQGDDPEADARTDERASDRVAGNQRSSTGGAHLASEKQRNLLKLRADQEKLSPSRFANAILLASGASEPREFASQDAAQELVDRMLNKLPAKLVDPVLASIEAAR